MLRSMTNFCMGNLGGIGVANPDPMARWWGFYAADVGGVLRASWPGERKAIQSLRPSDFATPSAERKGFQGAAEAARLEPCPDDAW